MAKPTKLDAMHGAIKIANSINSDNFRTYGTFAEIGGGMETSRYFFQASNTATTIAKAMSAYAMETSDAIYLNGDYLKLLRPSIIEHYDGQNTLGRPTSALPYTSRFRVQKMLQLEYQELIDRFANEAFATAILDSRRQRRNTSLDFPWFFVFANSMTVSNWGRDADRCHGWVGVRMQLPVGRNRKIKFDTARAGPFVDLLAHVVMLEHSRESQMDTLGIFGVQLLNAALHYSGNVVTHRGALLKLIIGDIDPAHLRVDVVDISEGRPGVDNPTVQPEEYVNLKLAYDMIEHKLTHSVLLSDAVQPELAGIKGDIVSAIKEHGDSGIIFPLNHQRVPQRFFSKSDVFLHELPIKDSQADASQIEYIADSIAWINKDERPVNKKHLFWCAISYFNEHRVEFYKVAHQFLQTAGGKTHSLLLTQFSDWGWLAEHVLRLTYDGGRVHLCFSFDRLREILRWPESEWNSLDESLEVPGNDTKAAMTRLSQANGVKLWSDSSADFLMRLIRGTKTGGSIPGVTIRVPCDSIEALLVDLDPFVSETLRFMHNRHQLILVS